MKKNLLLAAFVGLAMVSCKKDFTCECTSTSTFPGSTSSTQKYTIYDVSKGTAKRACIKRTYEYSGGGATYTSTSDCKLK